MSIAKVGGYRGRIADSGRLTSPLVMFLMVSTRTIGDEQLALILGSTAMIDTPAHTVMLLLNGGDAHLDGRTSHGREVGSRSETSPRR